MELRQLKTFLTVATLLSFNRAAEALHYAQSTVSAQIKSLEEDLGVKLFDRLDKQIILTEAGQRLVDYAKKILDLSEEIRFEVRGEKDPHSSLNIRIPETLCGYKLPPLLKMYRSLYPNVKLTFNTCDYHNLQQDLGKGIIDLAFLFVESYYAPNLTIQHLGIEPLTIIAHPDFPIAKQSSVRLRDLRDMVILLTKTDCSYRKMLERLLAEANIDSVILLEMNSIQAIKQCVHEQIGISIMPEIAVAKEISQKELIAIDWVDEPLEVDILMIWHKEKFISPALKTFMNMAAEYFCRN